MAQAQLWLKYKTTFRFFRRTKTVLERPFGDQAQQMIHSFLYAKMPSHLKRSINLAYLENGTYDQIVAVSNKNSNLAA